MSTVPHLVWFHHAGGHGDSYRALAACLPAAWQHTFVAYLGPGRSTMQPACTDLTKLAAALLPQLPSRWRGPMAFFGHSMGALVAYEVTRQLRQWGLPLPHWLGVSGHRAPQQTWPPKPALHRCADADLHARLRALGALPALAPDPDYLALVRADLCACETYAPPAEATATPLPCALSTFTGDADPMVPVPDMHPWSALVDAPVRHHVLPGGHFYLGGLQRRQVAARIAHDLGQQLLPRPLNPIAI
jgi:surfactin synthase thioesterase subunit